MKRQQNDNETTTISLVNVSLGRFNISTTMKRQQNDNETTMLFGLCLTSVVELIRLEFSLNFRCWYQDSILV